MCGGGRHAGYQAFVCFDSTSVLTAVTDPFPAACLPPPSNPQQGSDQIRQAFSKRKKGLVLKSYQLFRLTDAKVFMFVVNDKGSSWAYATPGFGSPLGPGLLRQLRDMAGVGDIAGQSKCHTEVRRFAGAALL